MEPNLPTDTEDHELDSELDVLVFAGRRRYGRRHDPLDIADGWPACDVETVLTDLRVPWERLPEDRWTVYTDVGEIRLFTTDEDLHMLLWAAAIGHTASDNALCRRLLAQLETAAFGGACYMLAGEEHDMVFAQAQVPLERLGSFRVPRQMLSPLLEDALIGVMKCAARVREPEYADVHPRLAEFIAPLDPMPATAPARATPPSGGRRIDL